MEGHSPTDLLGGNGTDHIPLDIFLSSPICRKKSDARFCDFIREAHNCIKDKKDNPNEGEVKAIIVKLEENASKEKWALWHQHSNWESVLGQEHFDLVRTFHWTIDIKDENGKVIGNEVKSRLLKLKDTASVIELLAIIRNKYEHNSHFDDEQKEKLNWYCNVKGKLQFDKELYAIYWNTKFPQLEAYLWWQFRCSKFRKVELKAFYPDADSSHYDTSLELMEFPVCLCRILTHQLEKGAVKGRYLINNGATSITLEIRTISNRLIQSVLDGNSILEIHFSLGNVTCCWYDIINDNKVFVDDRATSIVTNIASENFGIFSGTILIGSSICDCDHESVINGVLPISSNSISERIIIFTGGHETIDVIREWVKVISKSIAKRFRAKIIENPVEWKDVSDSVRRSVKNKSLVKFQNKIIISRLNEILSDNEEISTQLLSHLNGALLSDLLCKRRTEMLGKHALPPIPEIYIERWLTKRLLITANNSDEQGRNETISNDTDRLSEEDFLDSLDSGQIDNLIFIADKPGMGKSGVLASLARKLANKYRNRLIVFMTMSEFLAKLNNCIEEVSIMEVIVEQLSSNEFERNLVRHWLKLENAVHFELILDGLDEVRVDESELAIECLKMVHDNFSSVRVWVTLRDYMVDRINGEFSSSPCFRLEPFSDLSQIHYLIQYWSLEGNCNLSYCDLTTFAKECLKMTVPSEAEGITSTPLICKMIGQIYNSQVISGNLTFDKDNRLSANSLYSKLYDTKLEISLQQKYGICFSKDEGKARILEMLGDQISLFHMYYALQLIFSEKVATNFKRALFSTKTSVKHMDLDVLKMGIIHSIDPVTFLHRTVAEHTLASFLYNVLTDDFLNISKHDGNFQHLFWNDVMAISENNRVWSPQFRFPTLVKFLNDMPWADSISKIIAMDHLMQDDALYEEWSNVVFLNFSDSYSDPDGAFDNVDKLFPKFKAAKRNKYFNIMVHFFRSPSHIFSLYVIALMQELTGHFRYDFDDILDSKHETWKRFNVVDKQNNSSFPHWLVLGVRNLLAIPYEHLESGRRGWFPISVEIESLIMQVFQTFPSIVEQRDSMGRTPLLFLLNTVFTSKNDFMIPLRNNWRMEKWSEGSQIVNKLLHIFVMQFGVDVNAIDSGGNCVLHIPDPTLFDGFYYFNQLLEFYRNNLLLFMRNGLDQKLANSANDKGHTPLLSLMHTLHNCMSSDQIVKTILLIDIINEYAELFADFNANDWNGDTVLHLAISQALDFQIIKTLADCGSDICAQNAEGQCGLHFAVEKQNLQLVKFFIEASPNSLLVKDNKGMLANQLETTDEIYNILNKACTSS